MIPRPKMGWQPDLQREASGEGSSDPLVLIISSLSGGGAERVMAILANEWAGIGQNVFLLTLDSGKVPPFYRLDSRIRHVPMDLAKPSQGSFQAFLNNARRLRALRRKIISLRPQAVISFMEKTNSLVLLATLGSSIPVIVSERIDPSMYPIGRIWSALRGITYRRASRIVVQNQGCAGYFQPRFSRKLVIIPNPVPTQSTPSNTGEPQKRFLAMGRLAHQKGFDILIRAFAEIKDRLPEWSLEIYGEGKSRGDLERLVSESGLGRRVRLPGITRDPAKVMNAGGIFVLPSRFEGFPNVLCEAMAGGMPVIACDCPSGPREIISSGVNGVLVPTEDPKALADAMLSLAENPLQGKRLSGMATKVSETFSIGSVMALWNGVIAESMQREDKV